MASIMSDEQRLKVLEAYDPKEHLISVGKNRDGSPVPYYPANWRLYELSLRYPNANSDSEILHMDEKGNVIVRARVWLGKSYEESEKKAMAMKQGRIAELDKVEKKAKARAASDFGIGTEYALDFDDVDVNEIQKEQRSAESASSQQGTQAGPAPRPQPAPAGNAPRPVSLPTLLATANKNYPGGWDKLKKDIVIQFKVIGNLTDELVFEQYNIDAQSMVRKAMKKSA